MKRITIYILLFMVSCSTQKNLPMYKEDAEKAENSGDFNRAIEAWTNYFSLFPAMNDLDGSVYARAAKTAYKAGDINKAVDWFDQARFRNYADYEMYAILAQIFKEQDNLSKELSALEYIKENFEEEDPGVEARLFIIYHEIDMVDKAMDVWADMPLELRNSETNLEKYFILNRQLGNNAVSDSVSTILLELNEENVEALDWNATKFYNIAEERYLREMAEYEKNRTRRQYRKLLTELEIATADYKIALRYFEKLWELNPGNRHVYSGYLSNIYVRFNDEEKALYFRNYRE